MKHLRKLPCLLLALALVLTLIPATAHAAAVASGECGSFASWSLDEDGLLTISGEGDMWDRSGEWEEWTDWSDDYAPQVRRVAVESGIETVGSHAFSKCANLTEVALPDTVKVIDIYAFFGCSSLQEIRLPKELTGIGDSAFTNCAALARVIVPDSVKTLGSYAFSACKALREVKLPASLIEIGSACFSGCIALESVSVPTAPDRSLQVNNFVFYSCKSLKSVYFTGAVGDIAMRVFTGCSALEMVAFQGDAPKYIAPNPGAFDGVTTTVYYPAGNTTWTGDMMEDYGGTLTWKSYTPAKVSTQPQSAVAKIGDTVKFTVKAAGDSLTYRWQYKAPGGSWKNSGADGHDTSTLSIVSAASRNGYQYRCVVEDEHGNKAISTGATLTVKPTITAQPADKTASAGTSVKFTVKAAGVGLTYRWQYKVPGGSWKNSGATGHDTATLTISAAASRNGYQYRCVIVDANNIKVISTAATLTVK